MKTLAIDLETYSSVDLIKAGVYAYAAAPDFSILLLAYAYDDGPISVIDLASIEKIPVDVERDLFNPHVLKTAFNANFERTCLTAFYGEPMPPEQWECTAVKALTLGLPGNLDSVAQTLGLEEQKDTKGKALIRYFSVPCKATKANGGRTRNRPQHDPEKWEQFKDYCRQDVEVERAIRNKLDAYLAGNTLPRAWDAERKLWILDQQINDRGVKVSETSINNAIQCDQQYQARLIDTARDITGLENPKSNTQVKAWVEAQEGREIDNLRKENIPALLEEAENSAVIEFLSLKTDLSKTSIAKYEAMARSLCPDGRVHGMFQFYGANRTGRWAGRIVQMQNLPQNHLPDLDLARELLRAGRYSDIELLYDSVPDVLSQLIRTTFVPEDGHQFIVSDFSAIEARVIAWFAGEKWRLDVFNTHGKIYEASAAQMFKVPIDSIKKGDPLRQKGKIAELALGYGGSVGALTAMGALKMGLEEQELLPLVVIWRRANPNITQFWWDVDAAAMEAVRTPGTVQSLQHGLRMICNRGFLWIYLPSGRALCYVAPQIIHDPKRNREKLTYQGMNQTTKKWETIDTYGPKLVENIVQATARDCLAHAMLRLDKAGLQIVGHVHDEVILEVPQGLTTAEKVAEFMGRAIPWAPGLPMRADAYACNYYQKD